ncbi:MAG: hypothetical protein U0975_07615 [Erythrobacter sp.]|nr:hypothetical protein [Erythrobacter sp.]MDZ4272526.1 hypothetical protein [Erythrobacter sp.]
MLETPPLPPRLLHLPGGLRLLDERTDKIVLQLHARKTYATIATPEYSQIYATVAEIGLPTIGVEFPTLDTLRGVGAPDWQAASPSQGFALRAERKAWTQVRTLAQREGRELDADLANRASTYLDLAAIRLFDLSNCYSRVLIAFDYDSDARQKIGLLYRDGFVTVLEAAIHAFAADAASFRDLIVEAAWRLLKLGDQDVSSIGGFLKFYKNKIGTHPIGDELWSVAKDGWLDQLSTLRNEITHAAPIGGRGMRDCTVRAHQLGEGIVPQLHYPLFGSDGKLFDDSLDADFSDDARARATMEGYISWSDGSVDALDYAWRVTDQLVALLVQVRIASSICGEMPTITDKDIIGPVVFKRS